MNFNLEFITLNFKKYGFRFLFVFTFFVSFSLYCCIRGWFDIGKIFPEYFMIECGCNTMKKEAMLILIEREKLLLNEKDSVSNLLILAKGKLEQINKELDGTNYANKSLLNQRDSLEAEINNLSSLIMLKDSMYSILSNKLDSMMNSSLKLVGDSLQNAELINQIKDLKLSNEQLRQKNLILESVYITEINVARISDAQILVSFKLLGINVLKASNLMDSLKLYLQVYDETSKFYIEMVEKNPVTKKSKTETASCLIKFDSANGNEYEGFCYFINTQDKPFSKGLFNLNLKPKRFTFQFFLSGINRPLSYYPASLKRIKK